MPSRPGARGSELSGNEGWRFRKLRPARHRGDALLRPAAGAAPRRHRGLSPRGRAPRPARQSGPGGRFVREARTSTTGRRGWTCRTTGASRARSIRSYPGETGKLPWAGVGWYRKRFTLPARTRGRQLELDVDGAMSLLDGLAERPARRRLAVRLRVVPARPHAVRRARARTCWPIRLDNPPDSSRWYPGRRALPQRVAGEDGAAARRALGHVRHDAGGERATRATRERRRHASRTDGRQGAARRSTTRVYELDAADAPACRGAPSTPDRFEVDAGARAPRVRARTCCRRDPRLWNLDDAAPLRRGHHGRARRRGRRQVETPFGIRTIALRPRPRLPAERRARADPGRLQPPRPRRARRGAATSARSSASSRS